MSSFRPPADDDRCRAIVLVAGQRGRCRKAVCARSKDLCWRCWEKESWGEKVPRVPERAKA